MNEHLTYSEYDFPTAFCTGCGVKDDDTWYEGNPESIDEWKCWECKEWDAIRAGTNTDKELEAFLRQKRQDAIDEQRDAFWDEYGSLEHTIRYGY